MKIQLSDHFTYKKLFIFVLPSIAMMLFISIYGVVDGLFVSNFVGETALSSINLIMPFNMIVGGIGFIFGSGGTALVSKTLGEKNNERANRLFSMMIEITLLIGLIAGIVGIIFMRKIGYLLGATENMIEDVVIYGRIILGFDVCFMLQNIFQSFLITAEKPKLGLYTTLIAGTANMLLDGLFVAVFKWGVAGAAIATGLSQLLGAIIPFFYFVSKKNNSLLHFTFTKFELKPIIKATTNGASEIVNNVASSVVGIFFNFQLLKYFGENGISAYSVVMYVTFVFFAMFIGYCIGTAPIIGFHYGAGNHDELKNILKKSIIILSISGVCMFIISELLSSPITYAFVGYNKELLALSRTAFRRIVLIYLFCGINIFASSFFTALNNGLVSALISFLRTFVFQALMIFVLPIIFGENSLWFTEFLAEVFAFILSIAMLIINRKKYKYF